MEDKLIAKNDEKAAEQKYEKLRKSEEAEDMASKVKEIARQYESMKEQAPADVNVSQFDVDLNTTKLSQPMQVEGPAEQTALANPMVDMYEDDNFKFIPTDIFKKRNSEKKSVHDNDHSKKSSSYS